MSETVDRSMPTALSQAYAMIAHEDQDALGVIAGNFTLYNT